jgi:hypothetical protein
MAPAKIRRPLATVVVPGLLFAAIFFVFGLLLSPHSLPFILVVSLAAGVVYGTALLAGRWFRAARQARS